MIILKPKKEMFNFNFLLMLFEGGLVSQCRYVKFDQNPHQIQVHGNVLHKHIVFPTRPF
jgi:hypothetical protein